MSNLVNPQLVEGYVDDYMGQSVPGVYQGTLDAPQEVMLDKKLKAERAARAEITRQKAGLLDRLNETLDKIVRYKKRHNVKTETIDRLRKDALEMKVALERLDKIKI